jgi:prepilin signal peptidase PulO-like enzyme (type II secretory pathway)
MSEQREITINFFPARCPYCDEVVEYRDLQPGENRIRCEHCQREYIKIVEPSHEVTSSDEGEK